MSITIIALLTLAVEPANNVAHGYQSSLPSSFVLRPGSLSCNVVASFNSRVHQRRCRLSMQSFDAAPSEFSNSTDTRFILQSDIASSLPEPEGTLPEIAISFQASKKIMPEQSNSSWKDRLIDISNIASFLCVLDCTLLPLVSIALPAVSWVASGFTVGSSNNAILNGMSSMLAYLPALGHGIALFFVIPVGLLTTVVNYFFGHKELRFSLAALFGLLVIYAANSNGVGIASVDSFLTSWGMATHTHGNAHVHDACGAIVGATTGMLTHSCGEGWAHRLTNTVGCAFLLGSNYYGRKYTEKQSRGCAASALAEAWGSGNDAGRRRPVCLPGCGCEQPSYGANRVSSNAQNGGEMFFSWDRTAGADPRGRGQGDVGARNSRFRRFRK
jgi:hypothetical protein